MKTVITDSMKLKAEAYQYQVKRFGNYRPQKPLTRAIATESRSSFSRKCALARTPIPPTSQN